MIANHWLQWGIVTVSLLNSGLLLWLGLTVLLTGNRRRPATIHSSSHAAPQRVRLQEATPIADMTSVGWHALALPLKWYDCYVAA